MSAPLEVSCGFAPRPDVVAHARLAEDLGYRRVWLFDSPALYGDVWVHLALVAQATERIGLGPAVLVPSLRHPLTQASAIATLEGLAPGRLAVAIGTGFTGRMTLGQPPLPWKVTADYIAAVRGLLRGDDVEVDEAVARLIAPPGYLPDRPVSTPIVVAANGPKGLTVARELGDGVMSILSGYPEFEWSSVLAFGTVLDPGEAPDSARARAAAGPGVTVVYHGMYEGDRDAVLALPGGAEWRERLEQVPERVRHLALHEDHMVRVTERDAPLVSGEGLTSFTWTAEAPALRERLEALAASGATEILYAPMGPDIPRELEAFMAMATR